MHFLYSAAISKTLGKASPATEVRKAPSSLRSPGSISSSAVSKTSTLNSMGITHHLSNMQVRSRDINKILAKDAEAADGQADGTDDGTTRKLEQEFEANSHHSQEAANGIESWEGAGWTDGGWNEWVGQGCPDEYGITVPAGPAASTLNPMSAQHQPSSILVDPNIDVSVGMRDPDDRRH